MTEPTFNVAVLHPGDRAIVTVRRRITADEATAIKQRFTDNGIPCVIVAEGEEATEPPTIVINVTGAVVGDTAALTKAITDAVNYAKHTATPLT